MSRTTCLVLAAGVVLSLAGFVDAAPIYVLSLTPNPSPVSVIEGSPGAISWTAKNNSSSAEQTDNLSLVIDVVRMNAISPLKFLSGDMDDEAFNAAIVNPGQYADLVVPSQGTFVFLENFQSRDLSGVNDHDIGVWETNVVVEFHAQSVVPPVPLRADQAAIINVVDTPEPTLFAAAAMAFVASGRRGKSVPTDRRRL